jgi:hypothetical protein
MYDTYRVQRVDRSNKASDKGTHWRILRAPWKGVADKH